MRSAVVVGVLLAVCGLAQNYPKPNGFVNDFANQLSPDAVQSLEKKVRDYQRVTGVQIGVAVVPSLNGISIDEYSQGLFRAWGVGQYGINNGVLFVWAPTERQIRIHVGSGLESTLTNDQAARIIGRVRDLFRVSRYEDGVNAAVDGVIDLLGPGSGSASQSSPSTPPENEPPPKPDEGGGAVLLAAFGVAAALGIGMWLMYRRSRAARWTAEIPRQLAESAMSLQDAERKRADAALALDELRRETPDDVWRRFEVMLAEVPDTLQRERSGLDSIRLMPQTGYAALNTANTAMRRWQDDMRSTISRLEQVRSTLDKFRLRRGEAQRMLDVLPSKLARMEADGSAVRAEGLRTAAAETFRQASDASRANPANWLLVYDLLADVSACLEQIENPSRTRYRPTRYWDGELDSPAFTALHMLYIAEMQSSGGSSDPGSSINTFDSGGGGGFGGGDSGGGGASSGY